MKEIDKSWYVTATPEEQGIFKQWLHGLLHDNTLEYVNVLFNKKDGTEREMKCTTRPDIAVQYEKKTERKPNPDICFVFDTEKREWRSFRYDSIRRISFGFGQ